MSFITLATNISTKQTTQSTSGCNRSHH